MLFSQADKSMEGGDTKKVKINTCGLGAKYCRRSFVLESVIQSLLFGCFFFFIYISRYVFNIEVMAKGLQEWCSNILCRKSD